MRYNESEKLELKSTFGEWKEIIISLVAFANKKGGKIIVGFDNEGYAVGLKTGKNTIEDFANKIKNHTDPTLYPSINVKTFGPGEMVEIEIQESDNKPVFAFDKAFIRVGRVNQKLSNSAVRELINKYTLPDFDERYFPSPFDEIKFDAELIQKLNDDHFHLRSPSHKSFLTELKVLNKSNITYSGYLCFAENNQLLPNAVVKAARFKGNSMSTFIDMKDFNTNIISAIDKILEFIRRHINMKVLIEDKAQRKEIWSYPLDALREAVINAIVHRDYTDPGNIQIRIFDDRLEVWSPGLLPKELTIQTLLSESRSIPKNTDIARIFYSIDLIENWGTGFHRMVDACLKNGNDEPKFMEKAGAFVITFNKNKKIGGISGGINEGNGGINKSNGGINQLLQFIKKHQGKRISEISNTLKVPEKTLERWVEKLKVEGKVEYKGSKKTGGYYFGE